MARQRLPPVTHTDALLANQSQSILDNLVVFLRRRSCNRSDPERSDPQYEGVGKMLNARLAMSATWGDSENIYSLGVLPPVTLTGLS